MEDLRVIDHQIASSVSVVRIGIDYGETPHPMVAAKDFHGNGNIIETTVATEEIPAGMVSAGTDKGKGIFDFPRGDGFDGKNHTTH